MNPPNFLSRNTPFFDTLTPQNEARTCHFSASERRFLKIHHHIFICENAKMRKCLLRNLAQPMPSPLFRIFAFSHILHIPVTVTLSPYSPVSPTMLPPFTIAPSPSFRSSAGLHWRPASSRRG